MVVLCLVVLFCGCALCFVVLRLCFVGVFSWFCFRGFGVVVVFDSLFGESSLWLCFAFRGVVVIVFLWLLWSWLGFCSLCACLCFCFMVACCVWCCKYECSCCVRTRSSFVLFIPCTRMNSMAPCFGRAVRYSVSGGS